MTVNILNRLPMVQALTTTTPAPASVATTPCIEAAGRMQVRSTPIATAPPAAHVQHVGNMAFLPEPTAPAVVQLQARDIEPGNVAGLKVTTKKTTKKTTTKTTTTHATRNSTNAACAMTVHPWRAAGVALGAAVLLERING